MRKLITDKVGLFFYRYIQKKTPQQTINFVLFTLFLKTVLYGSFFSPECVSTVKIGPQQIDVKKIRMERLYITPSVLFQMNIC